MTDPEVIFNLWYLFDEFGIVHSLRARAYVASGSDEEKLKILRAFAEKDYLIAKPFPIPKKYELVIKGKDGSHHLPAVTREVLEMSGTDIFEDAIQAIEADIPVQTELPDKERTLVCITPLTLDENGVIRPIFNGRCKL